MRTIPFIHVYGELSPPHFESPDGRPYEPIATKETVEKAAAGIRIVSEGRQVESAFATAHARLAGAEAICFLGFGFHPANVERLEIRPRTNVQMLLGSAYSMGADEIERAKLLFDRAIGPLVQFGRPDQDALEFLRQYPIFR